jgi:hypothetical protein
MAGLHPLRAAITFTFTESGGNVYATSSGSATLPSAAFLLGNNITVNSNFLGGNGDQFTSYVIGNTLDFYTGGTSYDSGLRVAMDVSSIETNGLGWVGGAPASDILHVGDETAASGSLWTPSKTYVWTNKTIASIFENGIAPSGTRTVYTFANYNESTENRIDFSFDAVPEPSRALLIGLAGFALLLRRNRETTLTLDCSDNVEQR